MTNARLNECVCFSLAHWFRSMCLIFLDFFTLNDGRLEYNYETISWCFVLVYASLCGFCRFVQFCMCVQHFYFSFHLRFFTFEGIFWHCYYIFNVRHVQLLFLWLRGLNNRLQIAHKQLGIWVIAFVLDQIWYFFTYWLKINRPVLSKRIIHGN